MTLFAESRWQPSETLSNEQVAYYRQILSAHANDPPTGNCRICRLAGCPDWRIAYDHLAAAGQLMAEPERWLGDARPQVRP